MDKVPAMDLAAFLSSGDRAAVVSELRDEYERICFVVVCGHDLPERLLDRAFA
jgi:isopenicillin N synthase-like dioxygenase